MVITLKECNRCKAVKGANEFYLDKDRRRKFIIRLSNICKQCVCARQNTPENRFRQRLKARNRTAEYRIEERKKNAVRKGKVYMPLAERKEFYKKINRERYKEKNPQISHIDLFYKRMEQIEKAKEKPWLHPDLTKAQAYKLRYQHDEEFNIYSRVKASLARNKKGNYADLMRQAINRNGASNKIEDTFGYTISDLKKHLEKQFTKRMNWERFKKGHIHIDHIVPLSSYDLTKGDQLIAAWQLTNLRPMWAKQNIIKSDKREYLL